MKNITIIAGPCSVDKNNLHEVDEILSIKINNKKAIAGTRVVGLKSRTILETSGEGMGMDFDAYMHNCDILVNGGNPSDFEDLPSMLMAKEIQEKHNCIIATEIMNPAVQMPQLEKHLKGTVMPWNPSVNQLGWPELHISKYCERNNWLLGVKNPKDLGETLIDSEINNIPAPMEKVWKGVASYSNLENERKVLIHRGVNSEVKSDFRNDLVHKAAMRTKTAVAGAKMFFDPSHSCGPKLRDKIVEITIEAMKMKCADGSNLYDGILVEVGTSITDTKQHITIDELKTLVGELSKFREF